MENFEDAVTGPAKKSRHSLGVSPGTKTNANVKVVVASPPDTAISTLVPVQTSESPPADTNETVQQTLGIKSSLPSTFQGDRGGEAKDEELLAELRAISQKSSSAGRFAGENDNNGGPTRVFEPVENVVASTSKKETADRMTRPSPKASSNKKSDAIPPWKRGKKNAKSSAVEVDIMVAAPPTPSKEKDTDPSGTSMSGPQSFGIKDPAPFTFTGDRGGAAEDAELLAELRAISQKSSSASRFAEESNDTVDTTNTSKAVESVVASPSTQDVAELVSRPSPKAPKAASVSELLSWKRSKKAAKSPTVEVDVVVAAPSVPVEQSAPAEPYAPQSSGINDPTQSTFKGDRGGAAEDAELLAELRAISAKSSGADRFADESNGDGETAEPKENVVAASSKKSTSERASRSEVSNRKTDELPPWKRGKKTPTGTINP